MTTFTPSPGAPIRGTPTFRTDADAMAEWWTVIMPEMQAFSDDVTPLADAVPLLKSSIAYKGLWSSLSGALAIPASVFHLDRLWMLREDIANVAAKVPGTAPEWIASDSEVQIGATYTVTGTPSEIVFTSLPQYFTSLRVEIEGLSHNQVSGLDLQLLCSNDGVTYSSAVSLGEMTNLSTSLYGSIVFDGYAKEASIITRALSSLAANQIALNLTVQDTVARRGVITAFKLTLSGAGGFDAGSIKIWAR